MSFPTYLRGFVDDAAMFPPGNAPLEQAVRDHVAHRAEEYADLVGGFVVSDVKVADLAQITTSSDEEATRTSSVEEVAQRPLVPEEVAQQPLVPEEVAQQPSRRAGNHVPLAVNLVVTGGAGAIEPAVTWVRRSAGLTLRAVEFALRDEEDLAHNAQRLIQVVDSLGEVLDDVTVFAEPPVPRDAPSHGWLSALDELAAREVSLKFRTGGVTADLFPTAPQLAGCIEAALDRELAFKCTAGLHNAVRHRDEQTGFEHHGFLNVLLATRASLDGASPDDVAQVLDDTDASAIASRVSADIDVAARTRRWFTSFGSCSVLEAHEDLVELGLMGELA